MFRTVNLDQSGAEIPIEMFFNSIPRKTDITHPLLPQLPEGFFYTNLGFVGDSLFVSWEEQQDYSVGAAGFLVIKNQF